MEMFNRNKFSFEPSFSIPFRGFFCILCLVIFSCNGTPPTEGKSESSASKYEEQNEIQAAAESPSKDSTTRYEPSFADFIDSLQIRIRDEDSIPVSDIVNFPFKYSYEGFLSQSDFYDRKEEIFITGFKEEFTSKQVSDFEQVNLPLLNIEDLSSRKGYLLRINREHIQEDFYSESTFLYYFGLVNGKYKLVFMDVAG